MTSRLSIILLVGLLAMATARLHPDHVDDKTVAERLAAGVDKVMERIRRQEPPNDAPKPDAPKPDAPPNDAPKPDAPKPDAPKPDAPKPDAPKPDAPKPDAPPNDPPKPDAPKPDAPPKDGPPKDGPPKDGPPKDGPPKDGAEGDPVVAAWKKIIEKTQHVMGGAGAGALPTIAPDFVEFDN